MRHRIELWVIGVGLGCAVLFSGCPVALVGGAAIGTMAYLDGDLKSKEPHALDAVYAATHKVLKDLDMKVVEDTKEKGQIKIAARDEADRKVTITLVSQFEGITDVSIRIGVFGDEKRSRSLYTKIHQALQP